jgi:uncharacterized repeat protein (TIGR01451 family)
MKPFLRSLLLLLAWGAWLNPGRVQAQATQAFSCDGTFYQIRQGANGTSNLFKVNRSSSTYATTAVNVVNGSSNDLGVLLNGLAYNSQDGYMYALNTTGSGSTAPTSIQMYKIGANGISLIGTVTGMPNIQVASGTFDKSGHYFVTSQNTGTTDYNLYRFDLTAGTTAGRLAATALPLYDAGNAAPVNDTFYDIAYNPIDNYLYGVLTVGTLWRIDQRSNATHALVTPKQATAGNGNVGTAFFDVAGNLYAYSNGTVGTANSGGFYQVNLTNGAYTLISSIDPASVSDGASCINPGNGIDVTKDITNVRAISATQFIISYSIRVRNTYTSTDANVQVSDILTGSANNSTFPTASSVSIVTAPTVTNLDGATLAPNASYTGLAATPSGSAVSGAALLDGNQPLGAGQRALIRYTVQVNFASAASVPAAVQNNTAYASSTSVGPNRGYTLTTGGDLLSPNDLIATDASTNSPLYPALRPAAADGTPTAVDTPSPTPVTFAPAISGTVFEDVNYGGGAGRSEGTSQGIGRGNATVELYNAAGTLIQTKSTDATNGSYSFTGLTAGGTYTVRVVNSTVTSSRNNGTAGLIGVQTYRTTVTATGGTMTDVNRVGGESPNLVDAPAGTGIGTASATTLASLKTATTNAQSQAPITLPTAGPVVNVDFGYNFDLVVNTNTAGQGSLAQFITNANALGGEASLAQSGSNTAGTLPTGVETSIFMIPSGLAVPGQVAGLTSGLNANGVAVIQPTTALPTITGPTKLDGTTQTFNIGNTNNVTLGAGGTVGTANTPLAQLNGPEVQILGSANVGIGVNVAASATNTTIKGLAVLDFGNALDSGTNANIVSAANNVLITQNVVGTTAISFTAPTTPTNSDNVRLTGNTTGVVVSNNLIGFSNGKGIAIDPSVVGASISGNEIRSNGLSSPNLDGVDIQGSNASVTNNLFTGNSGQGIDSYHSTGGNTLTGNTITDNGRGTATLTPNETPGVRIYGAGNSISRNIISNNYGAGIMLEGAIGTTVPAASTTVISQNSIFGNGNVRSLNNLNPSGEVGIDLEKTGDSEPNGNSPYVTTNSATTTGANGLLNYPVITSAYVAGGNLVITGYSKPNAAIELFLAQSNPTTYNSTGAYFGQGKTYLTTLTEGISDTNGSTAQSYSGIQPNGVDEGSDTQANGFTFSIPLSSLPAAALTNGTLPVNTLLTATATLSNATSEFSGNVLVQQPPVPNDVTNVSVGDNQATPVVLSPNLSATAFGQTTNLTATTANTIASYSVSPATTGGTLYYNGTAITAATTVQAANLSQLTFVPTRGFIGNSTFTYTALDANNLASSTHKATDGTVSSGPATYTIPVTSAVDVTAAITGPTTLSAGQPTGTYTATFTNEGPYSASNVTQVITLPSGASVTGITNTGATVGTDANGNTTLTYAPIASLAANTNSVVTFAFKAPTTVSTTLTLAANTTTTSSEAANPAPNQATLTLSTVTTADVQVTTITPSATATTGKFDVTFTNNGPQTAAGVVYSVQLPAGLGTSNVAATNGGVYNNTTGLVSYATAATTLPSSGTFTSTITYPLAAAPSVPVTATARVSTTTDEAGLSGNNAKSATMPTQFDLTTTLTGPANAIVGSPTMLYVTTTNNGPNTAATAAQTVTIPSATTLAGSIYITNGGTYTFSGGTGTVTFPALTNLPSGQTVTNSISFLAPSANFAPTATVTTTTSTNETNTTNNTANFNVAVSASGTLANEATTIAATEGTTTTPATIVSPGSVVTYTVTSTNKGYTGANPSAIAIERVQLLPGLTTASLKVGGSTGTVQADGTIQFSTAAATGTGTVTTAGTSTYAPTTGVLTYYSVTQANGVTELYPTLAVTVPAGIGNAGQLVATASVSTTNSQDNVPSDNVASVGVLVKTTPDVATTITGPSSTVAGLPATYAVRFTNNGATDASTITETAQLPAGLSSVVVTDGNGSVVNGAYSTATGQVTFPSSTSLVAGASQVYTLTLTAPGQNFPVTSTIASVTNDGVSANNSASLSTTVTPNADLAVSISGPTTAVVGNTVTYVVTTTNNGPTLATGVVPTLQLPTGLTVQSYGGATVTTANGIDTYTFSNNSPLPPGGSLVKYVSFTMPSPTSGQITGAASVSSTSIDAVASNNTAALTTSTSPATTGNADLATSVSLKSPSPTPTSIPSGSTVTYTAAYRNTSSTTAAASVVTTASLPTGLLDLSIAGVSGQLAGNIITFNSGTANGATYNTTTGLLTFPTIASMAQLTSTSYDISFKAPGSGPLVVLSEITSSTSDNGLGNNRGGSSTPLTTVYDVTTTLAGPLTAQAGATNTYTVTTLNAGPSVASAIDQNVTGLPASLTTANLQVDGLTGTVSGSSIVFKNGAGTLVATYTSGTLVFPTITSQLAGAANELVHSFSFPMNAVGGGSVALTANVASNGEDTTNPTSLPNTSNLTTKQDNIAPVAQNVWNTLQSARANDANLAAQYGLPISPLKGSDADGVIGQFILVTVPTSDQGKLYYNGGGTALTANTPITDGSKLYFAPAPGYVGNATFTYVANDNGNGVTPNTLSSPVAIYTIPVAQDQAAATYTLTPLKGSGSGRGAYTAGDVIAYTTDANTATYVTTGTAPGLVKGVVYSADGGTVLPNASNGVTSATSGAFTSSRADVTSLASLGLTVDNSGRIVVSDPGTATSPKLRQGNYTVSITTIDTNGGVTTQTVAFGIPFNPLPVVLTAFTATATQNRDAKLSWTTASELNSAYFDIERSFDGTNFSKIGQLAGQGSTTLATSYAFTDAGVAAKAAGVVYYRLKQVDLDATATYSPVRSVSFTKASVVALSLYPNPAQASTTLDLSTLPTAATYQVLVLDATGRTVRAISMSGGLPQAIDLHELASGTYLVVVAGTQADGSALRQTLRLTKE